MAERAWIKGAQQGSVADLERLFREHWPRAYRAAHLVTGDAAAAEDIAQEGFLAAIRNLDRESNMLRNVRGALARIADGSYGICLHCEEDIKIKRLDAVPWAKFCIKCQEAADRHEFEVESGETIDELLANAA